MTAQLNRIISLTDGLWFYLFCNKNKPEALAAFKKPNNQL